MSTAYVYTTNSDRVERTIDDVRRVKLDGGFVLLRGRKKRTLLAMSEHSFRAAWRADAVRVAPSGASSVAIEVNDRRVELAGVEEIDVEQSEFGVSSYYVLRGDGDDDLPIAVLSSTAVREIAGVR